MSDDVKSKSVLFEVKFSQRGTPRLVVREAEDEAALKKSIRKEFGTGVKFVSVTEY